MLLRKTALIVGVSAFLAATFAAETVTLQQGLNGYSGAQDVSLYRDNAQSEQYSLFYKGSGYTGSPSDVNLVATQFTC